MIVQAIKNSNCSAASMDEAHLVYVYDHCYYIWWLATQHSLRGDANIPADDPMRLAPMPGEYLLKVSVIKPDKVSSGTMLWLACLVLPREASSVAIWFHPRCKFWEQSKQETL